MLLAALTPLLTSLGPAAVLVVAAVVFAETGLLVGFFLPGDSLLFVVGALVAAGAIGVPLWLVMVVVVAAAVLGDQVGYLVGRHLGPRWLSGERRARHAERAAAFMERHGSRAVVVGRFVPVVRTFLPVVAGVGRMPRRRFTTYNLLGGLLWVVLVLGAGHALGGVPWVAQHVEVLVVGVALLSVAPTVVAALRQRRLAADGSSPAAALARPDYVDMARKN